VRQICAVKVSNIEASGEYMPRLTANTLHKQRKINTINMPDSNSIMKNQERNKNA